MFHIVWQSRVCFIDFNNKIKTLKAVTASFGCGWAFVLVPATLLLLLLLNMNIVQEYTKILKKRQKNYNKMDRITVEAKQYTVNQSYQQHQPY